MVGCARGICSTILLQIQEGLLIRCSIIASRPGCPRALKRAAVVVIFGSKPSVFVIPILQYYNMLLNKKIALRFSTG
jgi:hypothetical protein